MRTHEVVIVGGGPAGSSCAWPLQRAGRDVLVVDKARFPRDKVCAGWVTPQAFAARSVDLADYRRGRVLQAITGFRTGMLGRKMVETRYPVPVSYGIRRCEFDRYLLDQSGAPTETGEAVTRLRREDDAWILNESIRARVVVGAGGHFCPVARHVSPGPDERLPIVAAHEMEFLLEGDARESRAIDAECPELYFCDDLKGYGWCFRKGDWLNVGFGRQDPVGLPQHLEEFVARLQRERRVPVDLPRGRGHAYLLYKSAIRPLITDGAVLIGDAAGLAYDQSGEGIRPAIESGLLAAQTILATNGDYSRQSLLPYEKRLLRRFGLRRSTRAWTFNPLWLNKLGGRILASPLLTRHLVMNRAFLHRHEPALSVCQ